MTPKQERFAAEYLVDLNATQAAIRAGYSAKTAYSVGQENLKKPELQSLIGDLMRERASRVELTADRVIAEIAAMAFYDPADLVEVMIDVTDDPAGAERVADGALVRIDGRLFVIAGIAGPRDIKRLPERVRRAIVGWGWDRNGNFTLKLADKSKALDQLARHLGLFTDRIIVEQEGLGERLERARKRLLAAGPDE